MRAHLDVMNDYFRRTTDGSYAYGERKTYIKELEELELDIPSLLLGISLRMENPSKNHYYGNINRVGRALSEAKDKEQIESLMCDMIKDNSLDDLNRIISFFLYKNYLYHLETGKKKTASVNRLKIATQSLPHYIYRHITLE